MRDIASHRAIGKPDSKGAAHNMATTNNMTEGGGGVVAVTSGANPPSSPVPDFSGDAVSLKEFANKRKVPGFAKVVKGSYMTIGSSKFSLQKQHHEIYIHSVKMGVKVLGHCVRRMDVQGHRRGQTFTRLYSTDQRLTVPLTYQGWFELLSEDGKSARPLASVVELAKAFPARCLVRENIKGYSGEGKTAFDKTKIIPAGEQLKLCGEVLLPGESGGKVKLLRCIDSKGDTVYLSFGQKGLFTPIAGEQDFTGVFNIRDIVRRFRLPLTVKLAQGVRPRVPDSKFSGIIRLDWVYTEETAFVCPVEKSHVRLLPVPCDVALQLVAATNQDEMTSSEMFRSMQAKCARMVSNYNNTLHLIVTVPESVTKTHARNTRGSNFLSTPLLPSPATHTSQMRRSRSREDILMDEIDDLYGYVRDGGAVPPKVKYQYDSDEESYWEEPAYEPLDEFRARLKAMEAGQKVSYPAFYRPADPTQLKGLVGGKGTPAPPPPGMALPLSSLEPGEKSESVYGVIAANGAEDVSAKKEDVPPPLPPRPADLSSVNVTSTTFSITVSSAASEVSNNAAPSKDPVTLVHTRRISAPGVSSETHSASVDRSLTDKTTQDSVPPRRVSRSDSEPSMSPTFPTSAAEARSKPTPRQTGQGEAAKLDWKERLRRFDALKDGGREGEKEASSSASSSSNSGKKKVTQRLARDFKDSDISSRTKASSSSDGRAVKKRMQTLYL